MTTNNIATARRRRAERALALQHLRDGRIRIVPALRAPKHPLKEARVWDVLRACPGLGEAGARSVCERARVWPLDKLEDLDKWDRYMLIQCLPLRVKE